METAFLRPSCNHSLCNQDSLEGWTTKAINAECSAPYREYLKMLARGYGQYFDRHPELRCPRQMHSSKTLADALPAGWERLIDLIPRRFLHRHARSAKSSQTLALALLGSAVIEDPTLRWLWPAIGLKSRPVHQKPRFLFERALAPDDLNERPFVTQIHFSVDDPGRFIAVECKWSEPGMGVCSCLSGEGNPAPGNFCAPKVIERPLYWKAAQKYFRAEVERLPLFHCRLAPLYQVVRNIAAAERIAGPMRQFSFVIIYDERNPYFRRTGRWPGWPGLLEGLLDRESSPLFHFQATSWQSLMARLALPTDVRAWAMEKHGLP